MKYRNMGSLDWQVSALGFGCMRLPQRRINRLRAETAPSIDIIRHGIDLGINYVDTAWPYHLGDSERIVGQALQDGYRGRVRLVTKSPLFMVRKADDFDRYLRGQLERLQTDYLDIYLFHALNRGQFRKVKELGLLSRMEAAREQGLIHHIGFSFHDTLPVFKAIVDHYPWDMVQIQYNYMDTGIQATTEGLKYAHGKGMAVVIMEPLKGGKLANPPAEALAVMQAASNHRSPVDWALQFLWDQPEVATVLSGMGTRQMVDENCASADRSGIGSLSQQEQAAIARLAEIHRQRILVPCTTCEYCMPCPAGVNIPQNFAILNNVAMEDNRLLRWRVRRRYRDLAGSVAELDGSGANGNASLCIQCGECLEKCPQQIQIPDELEKVDAILGQGAKIPDYF
jgi:predicted aldo/keto reductase-like oxidoreductase